MKVFFNGWNISLLFKKPNIYSLEQLDGHVLCMSLFYPIAIFRPAADMIPPSCSTCKQVHFKSCVFGFSSPQQLWSSTLLSGQHYSNHCQIRCHFQERADQVQDQNHQRVGQQRGPDLPVPHGRRDGGRDQLHHERESLSMSRTCVLMLSLQSAVSSCTWRYTSAICVHLGCQKPLWVAVCSSERCNRPDRLTAGSPRCGKGPKWPVTHDPALTYNTNQRVMGGEILSAPMEILACSPLSW